VWSRAYYTIAHLLQAGVFDGSVQGSAGISAELLTDDVSAPHARLVAL
jgi:hypothetical protein